MPQYEPLTLPPDDGGSVSGSVPIRQMTFAADVDEFGNLLLTRD
jgi:hypothetical protein